jgi:hypothetical protein
MVWMDDPKQRIILWTEVDFTKLHLAETFQINFAPQFFTNFFPKSS